jgi:hypothetical protein
MAPGRDDIRSLHPSIVGWGIQKRSPEERQIA